MSLQTVTVTVNVLPAVTPLVTGYSKTSKILADNGLLVAVSIPVQSMSDVTLDKVGRSNSRKAQDQPGKSSYSGTRWSRRTAGWSTCEGRVNRLCARARNYREEPGPTISEGIATRITGDNSSTYQRRKPKW